MSTIKLCDKFNCSGCAACANICPRNCISMVADEEGFLFPNIDNDKCIECGLCQKTCPVINGVDQGNTPDVYAAWNLDESIRIKSTSGGVFSVLSDYVLSKSGVVFGAVKEGDRVHHTFTENRDGISPMRGSKYMQSEIGESYQEVKRFLDNGRVVMFTGSPCQIAGLKSFLKKTPNGNLLTVETLCHGAPSSKIFARYMDALKKKYNAIDFQFRPYEYWGKGTYCKLPDGQWIPLEGRDDIYMNLFLKDIIHRESCYNCKFNQIPRCADITIADFWGIDKNTENPLSGNPQKGCSLLLINTNLGHDVFESIRNLLFTEKRSLEEAVAFNPNLVGPCKRPINRSGAYQYIFKHSWSRVEYHFLYTSLYRKVRHMGYSFLKKIMRK